MQFEFEEHMHVSPYAIIAKVCNVLLTIFLIARLASSFTPALTQQQHLITTTVVVLCDIRFVLILIDLVRGARPWQSAIFPSIVLLVLMAAFGEQQSALLAKVAAATAELGVLAVIVYLAARPKEKDDRPLEERLTAQLRILIPLPLARIMVTEMMIVRAAVSSLLRRRDVKPDGFSYAETSAFKVLPLLLLLASPVDIALTDLVLRAFHVTGEIWAAALAATDVYAIIWIYGMLVTMRERPHAIADEHLQVYKGIFAHAAISLETITSANVMRRSKRARNGSEDLSVRGATKIELTLKRPVEVTKWFVPDSASALSVTISADDPGALCRALKANTGASSTTT
ncbi:MAG: hypothetical protein KGJ78_01620 [Alphaproteobacteria bacterium]|nr:hypothetical protein [Alphaproteobacteria bacterium]